MLRTATAFAVAALLVVVQAWNKSTDLLVVGSVDHSSVRVLFEALRPAHAQRAHIVDSAAGVVLATTDLTFGNRPQVLRLQSGTMLLI